MLRSSTASGLNQSTNSLHKQPLMAQQPSMASSTRYGSTPSIEPRQTRTSIIRRNSTLNPSTRTTMVNRRQSMHFGDTKKPLSTGPKFNRASTISPTVMEYGQRDFVMNGGTNADNNSSSGMSTLERVSKKKELSSILRNKSTERSVDTVDGTATDTTTTESVVNGDVPKLSKENLSKHVRIFAVDNSDSEPQPTESELGYISDRRPSFGSLRGYNLHSRRISIDSLDTRRGDSRRGSLASVQAEEVF